MKKKIISVFVCMLMFATAVSSVSACTGLTYSDEENVFACHNEDWSNYNFNIRFFPETDNKFGCMFFEIGITWDDGSEHMYPFSGMNDQGLFYSLYETPYLKPVNSSGKPFYYDQHSYYLVSLGELFLRKCSTVDGVIDMIQNYNLEKWSEEQMLIADSTGNSAIIEGDDIIYKQGDFQVVTNFLQSHPELGGSSDTAFERYEIAVSMLENMTEPSIEYFRDICNATHQFYYRGWTVHSDVCDLSNQIMYLYYCYDYEKLVVIDLNEELSQGEHFYFLGSLFEPEGNLPPEKPSAPYGLEEPGKLHEEYTLKCKKINDPDGDEISYCFDWGDGNFSQWITSHIGTEFFVSASHSWKERGTYEVRVKARDEYGAESEWSDSLEVTMPKNKLNIFSLPLFSWLFERLPHVLLIFRNALDF